MWESWADRGFGVEFGGCGANGAGAGLGVGWGPGVGGVMFMAVGVREGR